MLFNIILIATFLGTFVLGYLEKAAGTGLVIVCGSILLAFLKLDYFKEFSGAGFKAILKEEIDSVRREIEPIKLKEIEYDKVATKDIKTLPSSISLKDIEYAILKSIKEQYFTYRSLKGIQTDLQYSEDLIKKALKSLEEKELLIKTVSPQEIDVWGITKKGHELISQLSGDQP